MLTANAIQWIMLTLSSRRSNFVMYFDDRAVRQITGWLSTLLPTINEGIACVQ